MNHAKVFIYSPVENNFLECGRWSDYGEKAHSYQELAFAIRKHGASTKLVENSKEIWRRMVFNILVNNNDDHLRNIGFLWNSQGGFELSPCYDIVPMPSVSQHRTLQLRVGIKGRIASIENALSEIHSYSLTKESAEKIIQEIIYCIKNWEEYFKKSFEKTTFDYHYFESAFWKER